jgi:hypothetical protein
MGGALLTSSAYANAQATEWAKGLLDASSMAHASAVLDRDPLHWGALASAFLVTTAGSTYLAITVGQESGESGGSALALKTPDGRDFKFFGWLINLLLALSPVWAALKIPATPF